MKDKILLFVIGLLVGAVISTGAFFIYTKANACDTNNQNTQITDGEHRGGPGGQNGQRPDGQSGEKPDGEPPEMPSDDNTKNNSDNQTDKS